ncbi:MAG: hypothetical protein Q7J98_09890 [Kiritimatiellia bacterium]|nr:hypothetical protein [Kiritimatiellia bacterium]
MNNGLMYLTDSWMEIPAQMQWGWKNSAVPRDAAASGHGGLDYYPMANFIRSILDDTEPPLDVYKSIETAAPGIIAALSAEQAGKCLEVPDFRPNEHREKGKSPANLKF